MEVGPSSPYCTGPAPMLEPSRGGPQVLPSSTAGSLPRRALPTLLGAFTLFSRVTGVRGEGKTQGLRRLHPQRNYCFLSASGWPRAREWKPKEADLGLISTAAQAIPKHSRAPAEEQQCHSG